MIRARLFLLVGKGQTLRRVKLDGCIGSPGVLLVVDDEHARQQFDLVTKQVKSDGAREIHEVMEDDFAEWTLLQRGVEGDSG